MTCRMCCGGKLSAPCHLLVLCLRFCLWQQGPPTQPFRGAQYIWKIPVYPTLTIPPSSLLPRQINLEYLVVDRRTFSTHEPRALKAFFGGSVNSSSEYREEIDTLACRLASVFITLKVRWLTALAADLHAGNLDASCRLGWFHR